MPHTLVRIQIEDFEKWELVFKDSSALRKAYGSKGVRVFRNVEKPNEVVLVAEYEDAQRARQLFQSQEFREATRKAGVIGPPEVTLLDEAFQLPA